MLEMHFDDGGVAIVEIPGAGWVPMADWNLPGWFDPREASAICGAACSLGPTGVLVEIGTWAGRSAAILADALGPGWQIHTVDDYREDYIGKGFSPGATPPSEARARASEILAPRTNVHRHLGGAAEKAAWWPGMTTPVRVLFVDGEHSEKGVTRDLLAWLPHLTPDAFIFLHDAHGEQFGAEIQAGARAAGLDAAPWARVPEREALTLRCYRRASA